MPLPPSSPSRDRKRLFVNRTLELAELKTAVLTPQRPDKARVIVRFGVGGQGKTALRHQLRRAFASEDAQMMRDGPAQVVRIAEIDFEVPTDRQIDRALLELRLQLGVGNNGRFPTFDAAFARYQLQTMPGTNIKQAYPQLFAGSNEFLEDLMSIAGDEIDKIPGLGTIYKLATNAGGTALRWWRRRGRILLADLDELSPGEILARLPAYLGDDLVELQSIEGAPRLCVIIDSYESLWRDGIVVSPALGTRLDGWLRELVTRAPGCLFIILSREELRWSRLSAHWEEKLEQSALVPLVSHDIALMIAHAGEVSRDISARIIASARGLPFYAAVQLDQWAEMLHAGLAPQAGDFGGTHEEVLARFVDHLPEQEALALRLASYPLVLDEPLFLDLCQAFFGGRAMADWMALARRSFVRPEGSGIVLHSLMRDHLQAQERDERPTLYREVHRFLHESFAGPLANLTGEEVTAGHVAMLRSATTHLQAAGGAGIAAWAAVAVLPFEDAGRYEVVEDVLSAAIADQALQADDAFDLYFRRAMAVQADGRNDEARRLYLACLRFIPNDPPDSSRRLLVICGVADCHYGRSSNQAAERLYRRALRLSEDADVDPEQRPTLLGSHGNVLHTLGHLDDAAVALSRAVNIGEQALGKDAAKVASWHDNLAKVQHRRGELGEAAVHYETAVRIAVDQMGERHPVTARLKGNLSRFLYDVGQLDRARLFGIEAEIAGREAFGGAHPHLASILDTMALILLRQAADPAARAVAEDYARQAVAVGRAGMRRGDIRLAHLENTLGLVLKGNGHTREARGLFKRVLIAYCRHLSSDSDWVAIVLSNIGQCYAVEGKHDDAARLQAAAVQAYERAGLATHINCGRILTLRASALLLDNRKTEADPVARRARAVLNSLPSDHPWVVDVDLLIDRMR